MLKVRHLCHASHRLIKYYWEFFRLNLRWLFFVVGALRPNSYPCSITISLTSYPERFASLEWVLRSLLTQEIRIPDIQVYLDSKHRQKADRLIQKYGKYEVTFHFCDEELKSYTKIIPVLRKSLAKAVITVDDDILYSKTMVKSLIEFSIEHPNCAIGHRGAIRPRDSEHYLLYREWSNANFTGKPSSTVFLTGMAGVYYPPNCFNELVLRTDLFKSLAPTADDIWLNYCLRKNFVKSLVIGEKNNRDPFSIRGSQSKALWNINSSKNGNNYQLSRILNKLGFLD